MLFNNLNCQPIENLPWTYIFLNRRKQFLTINWQDKSNIICYRKSSSDKALINGVEHNVTGGKKHQYRRHNQFIYHVTSNAKHIARIELLWLLIVNYYQIDHWMLSKQWYLQLLQSTLLVVVLKLTTATTISNKHLLSSSQLRTKSMYPTKLISFRSLSIELHFQTILLHFLTQQMKGKIKSSKLYSAFDHFGRILNTVVQF